MDNLVNRLDKQLKICVLIQIFRRAVLCDSSQFLLLARELFL